MDVSSGDDEENSSCITWDDEDDDEWGSDDEDQSEWIKEILIGVDKVVFEDQGINSIQNDHRDGHQGTSSSQFQRGHQNNDDDDVERKRAVGVKKSEAAPHATMRSNSCATMTTIVNQTTNSHQIISPELKSEVIEWKKKFSAPNNITIKNYWRKRMRGGGGSSGEKGAKGCKEYHHLSSTILGLHEKKEKSSGPMTRKKNKSHDQQQTSSSNLPTVETSNTCNIRFTQHHPIRSDVEIKSQLNHGNPYISGDDKHYHQQITQSIITHQSHSIKLSMNQSHHPVIRRRSGHLKDSGASSSFPDPNNLHTHTLLPSLLSSASSSSAILLPKDYERKCSTSYKNRTDDGDLEGKSHNHHHPPHITSAPAILYEKRRRNKDDQQMMQDVNSRNRILQMDQMKRMREQRKNPSKSLMTSCKKEENDDYDYQHQQEPQLQQHQPKTPSEINSDHPMKKSTSAPHPMHPSAIISCCRKKREKEPTSGSVRRKSVFINPLVLKEMDTDEDDEEDDDDHQRDGENDDQSDKIRKDTKSNGRVEKIKMKKTSSSLSAATNRQLNVQESLKRRPKTPYRLKDGSLTHAPQKEEKSEDGKGGIAVKHYDEHHQHQKQQDAADAPDVNYDSGKNEKNERRQHEMMTGGDDDVDENHVMEVKGAKGNEGKKEPRKNSSGRMMVEKKKKIIGGKFQSLIHRTLIEPQREKPKDDGEDDDHSSSTQQQQQQLSLETSVHPSKTTTGCKSVTATFEEMAHDVVTSAVLDALRSSSATLSFLQQKSFDDALGNVSCAVASSHPVKKDDDPDKNGISYTHTFESDASETDDQRKKNKWIRTNHEPDVGHEANDGDDDDHQHQQRNPHQWCGDPRQDQ